MNRFSGSVTFTAATLVQETLPCQQAKPPAFP